MKIAIIIFTGTKNTLKIATILKDKFVSLNHLVDIYLINDLKENADFSSYDLIGLGYPIYAFNAPKIFETKLKYLNIENKEYFIFKTSGEPLNLNNSSSLQIKRIMKKKKNILLSEYHLIMPYNIIFRYPDEFVKQIMYYNDKYINYIVLKVINKESVIIKQSIMSFIFSYIFKIQRLGAKINHHFYKVDESLCIKCNKCICECPVSNITINNNKINFNSNCQMCMRCSFNCPSNAIKIGFLNHWKVNTKYDLENSYNTKFINGKSKRFYKIFIKYYNKLDKILDL